MQGPATTAHRTRWACVLGAWAILAFGTVCGFVGVDYGKHWDEWAHVAGVRTCLDKLALYPDSYFYGGLYFTPGFVAIALHEPDELVGLLRELGNRSASRDFDPNRYPSARALREDVSQWVESEAYKVFVRRLFVLFSLPAVLWVFYAFRRLFRGRSIEALAAAAFLGLSWEVVTTARHIAPDAPLMQFVALQALALAIARRPRSPLAYVLAMLGAGAAGGLAAGCKTTGIITIVVALTAALAFPSPWTSLRARTAIVVGVVVAFVVAFFLATPNLFLDPVRYVQMMRFQRLDYNSVGPGYPYYVSAPWEHWGRLAQYLFAAVPSYFVVPAVAMSLVVLAGLRAWWKEDRRSLLPWLVWLGLYLFVLRDVKLLQIRNNLMLVPLLAMAFGAGLGSLRDTLARRHAAVRAAPLALAGACFALNAAWDGYTAYTIPTTNVATIRADAAAYVAAHDAVRVSPRVREVLAPTLAGWECRPVDPAHAARGPIVLYFDDHPRTQWLSNRLRFVDRTFASLEINYDWYSTWHGRFEHERIIAMDAEAAAQMSVDTSGYADCRRR